MFGAEKYSDLDEERIQKLKDVILSRGGEIVEQNDLGMTAHIIMLRLDKEIFFLKLAREGHSLCQEYQILKYLNSTSLAGQIPQVIDWLPELDGFLMKYQPETKYRIDLEKKQVQSLALFLKDLHQLPIPTGLNLTTPVPDLGSYLQRFFQEIFAQICDLNLEHPHLKGLNKEQMNRVKVRYQYFTQKLEELQKPFWSNLPLSLIHGDLSGDNIMWQENGDLYLIDWGATQIGSGIMDLANLYTYNGKVRYYFGHFLTNYFTHREKLIEFLPYIHLLADFYLYASCVQSLELIVRLGSAGLDDYGRHFLIQQMERL